MRRPPWPSTAAAPPRRPRPSCCPRCAQACACSTSAAGRAASRRGLAQRAGPRRGRRSRSLRARRWPPPAEDGGRARPDRTSRYAEGSDVRAALPRSVVRRGLCAPGQPASARARRRAPRDAARAPPRRSRRHPRRRLGHGLPTGPVDPWIDRFIEVHFKTWYKNGGEPRDGRASSARSSTPRRSTDVEVTAAVWCYSTPEETTDWGVSYAERLLTSPMGGRMVEYGFATRADLEAMAAAFARVGRAPRRVLGLHPWWRPSRARPDSSRATGSRGSRPARG